MRICFITGEYPPMEGGVGAFTQELALALTGLDNEVHVLTTDQATQAQPVPGTGPIIHRQVSRWDRRGIGDVTRFLNRLQPEVINLQYEIAAYGMKVWICLLPRVLRSSVHSPLVVTFHDLLPPYLFPKAGSFRQWMVWQLAQRAAGAIITNEEDQRVLGPRVRSRNVPMQLIPIGSNISTEIDDDYDRAQYRATRGWGADDLVVGFFGFMNRSKGIEALIEAIATLRRQGEPAELMLIGGRTGTSDATNAAYAAEIDALIERLGLASHVHRTGFASQRDISAALHGIDVCALPYRDGANLRRGTLHAALAHGCAIVTTAPPRPISELADGRNVVLVPAQSPDALAQAVRAIGRDEALRRQLGHAAADLAKRFTWPQIATETLAFYEDVRATAE